MSQDGLAEWMQAHRQAMEAAEEQRIAHETILGVLSALATWDITVGQAPRLLTLQATRLADEPTHAALYRQAVADLRQIRTCRAVKKLNLDDARTQNHIPSCGGLHFAVSSQETAQQSTSQDSLSPPRHARVQAAGAGEAGER